MLKNPLHVISLLFILCAALAGNAQNVESVFIKKDTIIIYSQGASAWGYGMYGDTVNPVVRYDVKKNALEKGGEYFTSHADLFGFSIQKDGFIAAAWDLMTVEILTSEHEAINKTVVVKIHALCRVLKPFVEQRIRLLRTDEALRKQAGSQLQYIQGIDDEISRFSSAPPTNNDIKQLTNTVNAETQVFQALYEKNPAQKIRLLTTALANDPYNAYCLNLRGELFYKNGKTFEALNDFSRAIETDSSCAEAYNNRGKLFRDQKRTVPAIADFSRAIVIDSSFIDAHYNRGYLYKEAGQLSAALADFSSILEKDLSMPQLFFSRAQIYGSLKQPTKAIDDLTFYLRKVPNNTEAYYLRGTQYRLLGSYENQAINDFSHALELNPNNLDAWYERGAAYAGLQQCDKAIEDFTHVLTLTPRNAQALYKRGFCYSSLDKNAEAIKDFTQVLSIDDRNLEAYYNRGFSYGAWKKYQQAIDDFTQVIAMNPQFAKAYFNRGIMYKQIKKYPGAQKDFNTYLGMIDPSDPVRSKVIQMLDEMKYDFELKVK